MTLSTFTCNNRDSSGRYCDSAINPCDYSFEFLVGTASNSGKYLKFRTKGFNLYTPIHFCLNEILSDNTTSKTVKTPIFVPIRDPWTVSYPVLYDS